MQSQEIIIDIKVIERDGMLLIVFVTTGNIYEISIRVEMTGVCGSPTLMICENNRFKYAFLTKWYGRPMGMLGHQDDCIESLNAMLSPYIGQKVLSAGLYVDDIYFHEYNFNSAFIDGPTPTVEIKTDKSMINFICGKDICRHHCWEREKYVDKINVYFRLTKTTPRTVTTYEERI